MSLLTSARVLAPAHHHRSSRIARDAIDPLAAGVAILSSGVRMRRATTPGHLAMLVATRVARRLVEERRAAQRSARRRRAAARLVAAGALVGGSAVALRRIAATWSC